MTREQTQVDEIGEHTDAQLENVTGGAKAKVDPVAEAISLAVAAILRGVW